MFIGKRVKYIHDTVADKATWCYPPIGTFGTVKADDGESICVQWDFGTMSPGLWWCEYSDVEVVGDEPQLVGFIHQYGDNDFSLWGVQLTEEDQMAIEEILEKYQTRGVSVRGDAKISINEVL